MYVLIRSGNGTLNDLKVRSYYTIWAAQQAMGAEFLQEYQEFYDTTEAPRDEDNAPRYLFTDTEAIVSVNCSDAG